MYWGYGISTSLKPYLWENVWKKKQKIVSYAICDNNQYRFQIILRTESIKFFAAFCEKIFMNMQAVKWTKNCSLWRYAVMSFELFHHRVVDQFSRWRDYFSDTFVVQTFSKFKWCVCDMSTAIYCHANVKHMWHEDSQPNWKIGKLSLNWSFE